MALLLWIIPGIVNADNTEVQASVTIINNRIIDLATTNLNYTSLTLTWTSPPSSPPDWGPATKYDIRYSLLPITSESEWQAATQLANPPDPLPPGQPETLLVIGLDQCTSYFFAIKATDSMGTWTAISNDPQGTTLCSGGGGGGAGGDLGGLAGTLAGCPLSLAADVQGNITVASMTTEGILCEACLAKDKSGKNSLELDKGTKLALAGNVVPYSIKFTTSAAELPVPENTKIISSVYELSAYSSAQSTAPSSIAITPSARLILNYDPASLPPGAIEGYIANYDKSEGWLALDPGPGVAEIGKAHCLLTHFSIYAVLAKIAEPTAVPAKFTVSDLTINPSRIKSNEAITISVKVANTGEISSDYNLDLKIDGAAKSSTQVTVAPGDNKLVNFTVTSDELGKHRVEISGLTGEFEVVASAVHGINWWLIGSIIGIIAVLAIWSVIGWKWYQAHHKP